MPRRGIPAHYEKLLEFQRSRMTEFKEVGWANRRIARHMGRSDAAIRRCWQEWGLIKDCVYVPSLPDDLPDFRQRIEAAVARITSGTLNKVWDEHAYRLDVCRVTNGAHIEQF
ncbi:uncharacterized protein TNCV_4854351 [Trichonephila clavipes]|nr:uncharacterized protein TNCV_4854351 [Trichonephila clavipes]